MTIETEEIQPDEFMTSDYDAAAKFAVTLRGRYILAQALYYGIKSLESVTPAGEQEKSNIADMKMLQALFSEFPDVLFDPEGILGRERIEEILARASRE